MALYLHNPESAPALPWFLGGPGPGLIGGIIGGFLGVGLKSHIWSRLLVYHPQSKTVEARDRVWGFWQVYPREGFGRLEFDAETGRLFEVRANGERRRVPVHRGEAKRDEWCTFIEQFERDHQPADPDEAP
ncbi:hypothetical protein [Glycomyces niveus]|uniref:Uncharacterized protein n=1 Tax=Glycomyces niveus TaxID=2820287 RepID=A0ABS3U515_9ACTN|nr:hypothetical protein [Glycomyces sp. NEAU-S30]MBO3733820.1 hypothetical protein [Glycomyces sp. NEAU-S30]